jgi:cytochrome P450
METLDVLAAVTAPDPYPFYARLAQRRQPTFDAQRQLWWVAHPDLVSQVLAHPDCRVRPLSEAVPVALAGGSAASVFGALVRMNEGAGHAVPKLVLQRALAGIAAEQVVACTTRVARALLPATLDGVTLSAWQRAVPVSSMASLLGFADAQLPAVAAWMADFVGCLAPSSSVTQLQAAHAASTRLLDAMRGLVAAPQAGSMLAVVVEEAQAAGWRRDHAILANLVGLLAQTYEASAGLIGNTIVALQRGARAAPAQLVQRTARLDPAIHNTRRFLACDTVIGGVTLPAGATVLVLLAAAAGAVPDDGPAFGFGQGRHACPGQALAHTMAAAAIACLPPLPALAWHYRPSVNARMPEFTLQEPA